MSPESILLSFIMVCFSFAGTLADTREPGPEAGSQPPPHSSAELTARQLDFSFRFFSQILKTDYGDNVFVSPLSASFALAMTYNGAEGETRTAMAEALALSGIDITDVNGYFKQLSGHLQKADPQVILNIANSIWSKQGLKFKKEFFELNDEYFGAQMLPLTDAATINQWVSDKTKGKIQAIIDRIKPEDIMVLINAIYFKAMWTHKFDSAMTEDRDFHLLNGTSKKHPLMFQSGKFNYYEDNDLQAICLPYGDRSLSMYVFLPSPEAGIPGFLGMLNSDNWAKWTGNMIARKGDIYLPRFKLEYEKDLNEVLKGLGMGVAFDPIRADFSGMYDVSGKDNLYISDVRQKTFVEVNEAGTEAAAVTSVTMTLASAPPAEHEKFVMVVDRPFLCAITDNTTGAILFLGIIVDP
jgi:serine protease inhibitor